MEIDRVPLPLKSFPIDAASRLAGLPADPAERDPHLREEAADLQSRSALAARRVAALASRCFQLRGLLAPPHKTKAKQKSLDGAAPFIDAPASPHQVI